MISGAALFDALRQYRLVEDDLLERLESELFDIKSDALKLVDALQAKGILTGYQAGRLLANEASILTLGQHIILDKLGEGGMGYVLKARHRLLRRIDAIKVIRPECLTSQQAVIRFFREAQAVASLRHQNIIQAYDANKEGDRHYIVMEFVSGTDLGKLVQRHGPLPIGIACDFIRQAALGLQHAHERKGMVHRDIKPTNLMLAPEDRAVKVLDLGLAQLRSTSLDADTSEGGMKTPQGMLMGTPDYMAPEQAEDSSSVDIRADIYSLGCSFYQLLAGIVPYPGGSLVDKLTRHNSQPPPPLGMTRSDVPMEVIHIVERMMAKKADDRFPTPGEVAVALALYSFLPKGELFPEKAPGSASDLIPQTLMEPGSGYSGPRTSPLGQPSSGGKTAPLTLEPPGTRPPSDAAHIANADTVAHPPSTVDKSAPTTKSPTPKPKMGLAVGVLAGFAIAGLAAFLFMQRNKEPVPVPPPPIVKNTDDPTKDDKKTDQPPIKKDDKKPEDKKPDDKKPEDKKPDDKKPTDKPPPPDPRLTEPGVAKSLSLSEKVEAIAKEGKEGAQPKGVHAGKMGKWQRVETLAKLPVRAQQNVTAASISQDGTRAAVLSGSTITVYDFAKSDKPETVEPLAIWRPQNLSGDPVVQKVGFIPNGADLVWLTINTTDEKVKGQLLPLAEYETLVRWDGKKMGRVYLDFVDSERYRNRRPTFSTRGFAFSSDGKSLAVGTGNRLLRWTVPLAGQSVDSPSITRLEDQVEGVAFSPDGGNVVVGLSSRRLALYPFSKDSELPLFEFKGHEGTPRAIAFVGEKALVSGDSRGQILLWKIPSDDKGEPTKTVLADNPHKEEVTCATAGKVQGLYATGSKDGWIRVGKIDGDRAVLTDHIDGEEIKSLGFASKGTLLFVLTDKQLLRIDLGEPSPISVGKADDGDSRGIAKEKK